MSLVVRTPIQMRFSDVDMFGHANNVAQQMYFDQGKSDLFKELWRQTAAAEQIPALIVSLHNEFYEQILYGEDVVVETFIESVGNKSLTLFQRLLSGQKVCSVSRAVMVCYDRRSCQSVPVPSEWLPYVGEK